MEAAPKSRTKKAVAAALAAAMVAAIAPVAALSAAGTGNEAGVEAAYAATTADKLSAAAAAASSQAPYAAQLAKDKVAGWDGTSKVKTLDENNGYPESALNPINLYSDGTDEDGHFSADSGKTVKELATGCSGVTAFGVRWAFSGGKVEHFESSNLDQLKEGYGTIYIDCDGAYDPYTWSGEDYSGAGYGIYVTASDYGTLDILSIAKNVVVGKHVTELAYHAFDGTCTSDDAVLTFEEPSSLTKVASYAFSNASFSKITFPASLKEVDENGLYGGFTNRADISFKDPANTVVDPGAINNGNWSGTSAAAKKVGKVKKLTAGKKSLTVSMKRVTGGKAYRVYYRQAGTTKYKSKLVKKLTSKNSTKSTVTYTIKGLKKGKKYQVHYIAYKKTSAKSSSAITRTPDKTSPKVK